MLTTNLIEFSCYESNVCHMWRLCCWNSYIIAKLKINNEEFFHLLISFSIFCLITPLFINLFNLFPLFPSTFLFQYILNSYSKDVSSNKSNECVVYFKLKCLVKEKNKTYKKTSTNTETSQQKNKKNFNWLTGRNQKSFAIGFWHEKLLWRKILQLMREFVLKTKSAGYLNFNALYALFIMRFKEPEFRPTPLYCFSKLTRSFPKSS